LAPSAIDLASSSEKPIHVPAKTSSALSKSIGRPGGSSVPEAPGLWVYLWRNLTLRDQIAFDQTTHWIIASTIAAGRYKQMTASQKKGDVSVAFP
jgi:hypothetical protein